MAGEEIVQLYIGYEDSQIERHIKELKGFKRVYLEPQQTKVVTFCISANDLKFYNVDKEKWDIEKITYKAMVGPSSDHNKLLCTKFTIV